MAALDPALAARADRQMDHLVAAAEDSLTPADHESLRDHVALTRATTLTRPPAGA